VSYRVRSKHGEIRLKTTAELKDAWDRHLIDPEDEVQEDGSTEWRKASAVPALASSVKQRTSLLDSPARWYLWALVVAIVGAGLLFIIVRFGVIGFVVAFGAALLLSSLFTRLGTRRKRR
jgi:hypothetical protein